MELDPPVAARDVTLPPPGLDDLRADAARLLDALAPDAPPIAQPPIAQPPIAQPPIAQPPIAQPAIAQPLLGLPVLAELPARLREQDWSARVAVHRDADEIVAITAVGTPLLGLAVDLGTTKLAAYLLELESGKTLARAGAVNPQIAHGEDVLSRISFANRGPAARRTLQKLAVEALDGLTDELCERSGQGRDAIVDCVVVGNTAMHHLFAGLPVRQLGHAPYVAAHSGPLPIHAGEVGLPLSPARRCICRR